MVADDMGYDDVSYHGSKQINTPTLDKFVANGITLDQFYTQCVCTPSRAALLTSLYPIHTGLVGLIARQDPFGLPLKYTILPEILKNNSYDTFALGKWHLV